MKIFLTGATGFIGGELARQLRARGDEVATLVRTPSKAVKLEQLGCDLVAGEVTDAEAIEAAAAGCDLAFHAAAVYRVGIPASEREAMYRTNVTGTEVVLDACTRAGVGKIVYVSTANVFGNTEGRVVDETYERDPSQGYLSYYDEAKYLAHVAAKDRIARGAPIVIVCPGGVYGPEDASEVGEQVKAAAMGKVPFVSFPRLGFNLAHVEDIANGLILAAERGQVGETYCIGGELSTLRQLIDMAAKAAGRKPPRFNMPVWAIKASIPLAPIVTKMMGLPPNLKEIYTAGAGVTYWFDDSKARRELGYTSRSLHEGLAQTMAAL